MTATLRTACLLFLLLFAGSVQAAENAKVLKVLPHLLDLNGRNSIAPSLYERDAYQDFLRKNPQQQSALRFDIRWKAKAAKNEPLRLRLEVRTGKVHFAQPLVLERTVRPGGWFGRWSSLSVEGKEFKEMGEVVAWRASLWSGNQVLAEQKSFLW